MNPRSSSSLPTVAAGVPVDPEDLRVRLGDAVGPSDVSALAAAFAALYEPFRLVKPGRRAGDWAEFLVVEGLRVEDLDSQPSRDVVRLLSCALYGVVGMSTREIAAVVGTDRATVSRWASAAGVVRGGGFDGMPAVPAARRVPPLESAEDVRARVLAGVEEWVAAQPKAPGDSLVFVEEQLNVVPSLVQQSRQALEEGGPVDEVFDGQLRRCLRKLNELTGAVKGLGAVRGLRL